MAESHDVVVLGCGLMGSALARSFATRGYSTGTWNRTHERAEALAADGVMVRGQACRFRGGRRRALVTVGGSRPVWAGREPQAGGG
ncbi:NAD(P)-binding domain-containing protein [Mycolicibacterium insubricum]|uniref:6-phosphogluconate dehydrogenase NADP-binding domain-containing protein n=1 Tax=Mycolicibacterium insubricum TaxID=444597 RepID=A0A1X0DGU7_9MYCO|nr:hypothetical protein [Mycolicibacterium insubricum]ORA71614.1 hypothetical protein BST26_07480 [Mycolicibacterium insubricum]